MPGAENPASTLLSVKDGALVAVLDVDSYDLGAFDDLDAAGLAPIAALLGTLAW